MKNEGQLAKYWLGRLKDTAENKASLSTDTLDMSTNENFFSCERERLVREFAATIFDDELACLSLRQILM